MFTVDWSEERQGTLKHLSPRCHESWIAKLCLARERCVSEGFAICVFAMLTKWFSLTRLETRTKESNVCVSIWVSKTLMRNESEGDLVSEVGNVPSGAWHYRPIAACGRFE